MADLKISQLSSATALAGTEVVPVVQGGSTKKATIDQILSPASGKGINFSAAGGDTLTIYDEGSWTPTVTASSGTLTTVSATGNYTRIGRQVTANIQVTLTNAGTASGALNATLPFTCGQFPAIGCGREDQNTGAMLQARIPSGTPTIATILTYANLTAIGTGNVIQITITYFV